MTPEALFEALRAIGPAAWFDAPGLFGAGTDTVILMLREERVRSGVDGASPLSGSGDLPVTPTVDTGIDRRDVAHATLDAHGHLRWSSAAPQVDHRNASPDATVLLGMRPGWYAYESAPRVHAGRVCVRTGGTGAAGDVPPEGLPAGLLPDIWRSVVRAAFVWSDRPPGDGEHAASGGRDDRAANGATRRVRVVVDPRDADTQRDVEDACREAQALVTRIPAVDAAPAGDALPTEPDPRTRERYCDGVRTIQRLLREGECYQVNLARHIDVPDPRDPLLVWRRLRARNPARRSMLVHTPHGAVVSNSPELLLHARGERLRSVPIKGTSTHATDAVQALRRSEKERAELRMIVDLVRADLGRVAVPGSVRAEPRRVGPVGHVHHAVQAVHATLAPGRDARDAFRALFPAGSITGAPRLRAMEVIRDLEAVPRGVYCGSLGAWLPRADEAGGAGWDAWWNVAIRTVTFARGIARVHVGAGIVLDSDPERELHETALKARRMLEALA